MTFRTKIAQQHPLFFATISLIFGIAAAHRHAYWFVAVAIALALLTCVVRILAKKQILILVCCVGATILGAWRYYYDETAAKTCAALLQKNIVTLSGRIETLENIQNKRHQQYLDIVIFDMQGQKKLLKQILGKRVRIFLAKASDFAADDQILIQHARTAQPATTSFQEYLFKEGLIATAFCNNDQLKLIYRPTWSYNRWITQQRIRIAQQIVNSLSPQHAILFSTMFLGLRTQNDTTIQQNFHGWGIAHCLARSGLHLIIFIALWQAIIYLIPLTLILKHICMLVLIIIYALFSWTSISFVRAISIFLLARLCSLLYIPIQPLHILTISTLFVLLYNPYQLFFADFQLSFSLTFALMWYFSSDGQKSQ